MNEKNEVHGGDSVSIWVNGERRQIQKPSPLTEMLRSWGQDPRTVAVELNGSVIRRATFDQTLLQEGDRIEIVRFVQGG
ncbi:MAG: sulfur carrier protein ThiS [Acidobacteriota bacterium]